MQLKTSYTFDDYGISTREKSTLQSRSEVSLKVNINNKTELEYPLISSPMDTVTNGNMAIELNRLGAVGIIHRFQSIKNQELQLEHALHAIINKDYSIANRVNHNIGAAVGVTGDYEERLKHLIKIFNLYKKNDSLNKLKLWICFDTANGFSTLVENAINNFKTLKDDDGNLLYDPNNHIIITGNITSVEAYKFLESLGIIDICRISVGSGSACITSDTTGLGVSAITTIQEIQEYLSITNNKKVLLCVDGGIRHAGDCVKSFAFGADLVMLGRMFAGFAESPGNVIKDEITNKAVKQFRGLASKSASDISKSLNNITNYKNAEGIETFVQYKGNLEPFFIEFTYGIKSAFSYLNSVNFNQFREYFNTYPDSIFILSNSTKLERKPKYIYEEQF